MNSSSYEEKAKSCAFTPIFPLPSLNLFSVYLRLRGCVHECGTAGERRVANGEWQAASGKWRAVSGEWRVAKLLCRHAFHFSDQNSAGGRRIRCSTPNSHVDDWNVFMNSLFRSTYFHILLIIFLSLLPLLLFLSSFFGSGPDRGQSPVEWGEILSVQLYIRVSIHPASIQGV